MSKKKRLEDILSIIKEREIDTQEELTDILIKKGYDVSQATISRDINELGLVKVAGDKKKFRYFKPEITDSIPQKIIELFKQITISIVSANNLVVIKTLSGNASSAGMAVDRMSFKEIIGSIAGDDTLLIIAKTNADAEKIVKTLKKF